MLLGMCCIRYAQKGAIVLTEKKQELSPANPPLSETRHSVLLWFTFHNGNLLIRQPVEHIHQAVNLCVCCRNLPLNHGPVRL